MILDNIRALFEETEPLLPSSINNHLKSNHTMSSFRISSTSSDCNTSVAGAVAISTDLENIYK